MSIPKNAKGFPSKVFGRDEYAGHLGPDYADDADSVSSADVVDRDSNPGNGYELVAFRGMFISQISRKEILAREESIIDSQNQSAENAFRSKAGFSRTIS